MRAGADADEMAREGSESKAAADRRAPFVEEWPVVAKTSYDAFVRTNLKEQLRAEGVRRVVVVCGTLTDCCVGTTAEGAFNQDFWLGRRVERRGKGIGWRV